MIVSAPVQDMPPQRIGPQHSLLQRTLASIRAKTIVAIAVVLVLLLLISALLLQNFVLHSYLQLEEQAIHTDLARINHAIEIAVDDVDTSTLSWSAWDETYTFVEDRNQAYLDANTSDNWFVRYNINMMVFVDSSGQIVFSKYYDLARRTSGVVPPEFVRYLSSNPTLLRFDQPNSRHAGMIVLPQGPLIVSARPIVRDDETGPIRGTVVFGRYLDSVKIAELSKLTELPFTVSSLDATGDSPDTQAARATLRTGSQTVVDPLNDTVVVGYGRISDITNRPALVTRLEQPRDVYTQGQRQSRYLLLALALGGVLLGAVILFLVERLVLQRVVRLDARVAQIGTGGDLTERVAVLGGDELAHLGASINTMLDAQAHAQTERMQIEEARVRDLERAADEQRALVMELEASLVAREALSRTVQELSAPVIPVLPGTIVVPLVGVFDEARADDLQNIVLHEAQRQQAADVIIDVTGMPLIDTAVAQSMIRLTLALRLIGAQTVLVGIRPEVAQTLVQLGVTLAEQKVAADLQTAVMAIARRGRVRR